MDEYATVELIEELRLRGMITFLPYGEGEVEVLADSEAADLSAFLEGE